jgi:hypothetical protein
MTLKRFKGSPGTTLVLEHVSEILKDNPLGDPHVRKLAVWLPSEYDHSGKRRFPVLYDLVGFTGSGLSHVGWKSFGDNVPERAARLIHEGKMGPVIIVFPVFPALGGSQYVHSTAVSSYADYPRASHPLRRPRVPHPRLIAPRLLRQILRRLRLHDPRHEIREVLGRHRQPPGDAFFDFVYWHWLTPSTSSRNTASRSAAWPLRRAEGLRRKASAARTTAASADSSKINKKNSPPEGHAIMNLCMAATYDPDRPSGFRIPFNLETGEPLQALAPVAKHDPSTWFPNTNRI